MLLRAIKNSVRKGGYSVASREDLYRGSCEASAKDFLTQRLAFESK